jgi:hypothetical protein
MVKGEGVMDKQVRGEFSQISERDKEIQASIWALIFLTSEMALAFRALRDKLEDRGALRPEDNAAIDQLASEGENLRRAYEHIEKAFREKYDRVWAAMEAPAEVTNIVQEKFGSGKIVDLNDQKLPVVTGTK